MSDHKNSLTTVHHGLFVPVAMLKVGHGPSAPVLETQLRLVDPLQHLAEPLLIKWQ